MRDRLTRALCALLILMTGFNPALAADSRPFSKADTVLRGNANGMRAIVQGYTGGTGNWSGVARTRHVTKTGFCSAAAVMPMFIPTGTPIADTELKSGYTVQVGIEYPWVNANANIPPRTPLKWDVAGSTTGTFTPNGKMGYLRSTQTALPFCVPAGAYYGLWTTVEAVGRAGAAAPGIIPWTHQLSNFNQRYTGGFTSATSQIDANTALTATSITQAPATQSGGLQAYAPAMLLTPYKAGEKAVGSEGDSINNGVNEGAGGSSTFGDVEGSPQSSSGGFVTRGITDTLGVNVAVQLAKPTDGAKFKSLPGGFRYRGQLLQIANPTNLIVQDIQNDTQTATASNIVNPPAWVATTYVNRFETRTANSNVYVAVAAGTTSSTAPSHTTATATDGTVTWLYWGPNTNGYPLSGVIYARQAQMQAIYRQLVPGVKITRTFGTPYSSSSDNWATAANQTAVNAPPTSAQSILKQFYRTTPADTFLGTDAYWDPNVGIEDGYTGTQASESAKWPSTGTANDNTIDGVHGTSRFYSAAGATATPSILP